MLYIYLTTDNINNLLNNRMQSVITDWIKLWLEEELECIRYIIHNGTHYELFLFHIRGL